MKKNVEKKFLQFQKSTNFHYWQFIKQSNFWNCAISKIIKCLKFDNLENYENFENLKCNELSYIWAFEKFKQINIRIKYILK